MRYRGTDLRLTDGCRVKNLRTGRVGLVFESIAYHPGKLIVVPDREVRTTAHYLNAPLASELEAYEAEYPGTYDIVTEGAPW